MLLKIPKGQGILVCVFGKRHFVMFSDFIFWWLNLIQFFFINMQYDQYILMKKRA